MSHQSGDPRVTCLSFGDDVEKYDIQKGLKLAFETKMIARRRCLDDVT